MLREDDFSGEQKANLASSLAQVGEPENMPLLREMIQADIARVRRGREAKAHGDRGRLGNGGNMSYAIWHVRALLQLAPGTADQILLEVVKEPEYEREAAWSLVQSAITSKVQPGLGFGLGYSRPTGYAHIWEARQGRSPWTFNEGRRKHQHSRFAIKSSGNPTEGCDQVFARAVESCRHPQYIAKLRFFYRGNERTPENRACRGKFR